jgi:hypothetical protein
LNNYRSIAITPPFTKLLMAVINQRLTNHAEDKEIHAPTQAGFRRHHTTTEHALLLQSIVQYSNHTKRKLGLAFIDLHKAYDGISREKLWTALIQELKVP